MSKPAGQPAPFDPAHLERLACPVCFGPLALAPSREQIRCNQCGSAYPVIDNIPVLIPDRSS